MYCNNQKYKILPFIKNPKQLKKISEQELSNLCEDIRNFLLSTFSSNPGHFASGLGVVELTVALHYIYESPKDNIIWDTGHQTYPHKILTERKNLIHTIRRKNGLHPFPNIYESKYDCVSVGHSSTSLSYGLGIAVAENLQNTKRKTICVIGDGAITAGMAFEAINHTGITKSDILIVLNNNKMSISENVGTLSKVLTKKNFKNFFSGSGKEIYYKKRILKNIFLQFGFSVFNLYNGNDVAKITKKLKKIKDIPGPKLLNIFTKKGFGYVPAEKNPIKWHFVKKFSIKKGEFQETASQKTYSTIFGNWLCTTAKIDKKLIAITPAMREGSGMTKFAKEFPKQYFDVAIAEQHAITFAAGLAIKKHNVIVAIYSTFLQRAYDQIIHDVALPKLPILFAIDRAGIVGEDGSTHQGAFDLSYLRCIPNIIIMTPSSGKELKMMLNIGHLYKDGPVAIRYPKKEVQEIDFIKESSIKIGKANIIRIGKIFAILNFSTLIKELYFISNKLDATLVDMRFVKPIDEDLINRISEEYKFLITIEENTVLGGAGSTVNEIVVKKRNRASILNIGLPDKFIPHGTQKEVLSEIGLDTKGIIKKISNWIKNTN
ncbi:1-deoxy-D-xylulose-5-phosphate synthase [bacterium endosymbiont of Pedicinus badii]|uniref:1-deoxy-D-xylulose-5-phosphate synthase n=1 Tax=bacterium endosymbiont of Pedicinus badii TaxID=1719126 RepID=UPI0009BC1776|nr:1-deoxy-D-xylulose-5-phosphate synthase [bacterium endosymbiont of Pedicinus badii]OQM34290.1 1-deoxy-D-xylulose-5-phosphate synthase [bacterium endosymbiont of Pedicinus badii]